MTFSIVARSADGTAHGVAVASKFLAVGAAVSAASAGVGALATQSYANLAYKIQGLTLLSTGCTPADAVAGLVAADPERAQRQVGIVGRTGDGATYTGDGCHAWAGGVAGDGYAIQGNILTGPEVVEAIRDAWLRSSESAPLASRLLAALRAGDEAGGDRRGRQSAALLVVAPGQG
ncbi:MAG TPA: fimbrial assembly protein FimA, partial [Micromonosporaceae bacterium]|nr:fimbrial assembly protein FimA [Micromonosporaceae bacterium]